MLIRVTGKYGITYLDLSKLTTARYRSTEQTKQDEESELYICFSHNVNCELHGAAADRVKYLIENLFALDDINTLPVEEAPQPVDHPKIDIPF